MLVCTFTRAKESYIITSLVSHGPTPTQSRLVTMDATSQRQRNHSDTKRETILAIYFHLPAYHTYTHTHTHTHTGTYKHTHSLSLPHPPPHTQIRVRTPTTPIPTHTHITSLTSGIFLDFPLAMTVIIPFGARSDRVRGSRLAEVCSAGRLRGLRGSRPQASGMGRGRWGRRGEEVKGVDGASSGHRATSGTAGRRRQACWSDVAIGRQLCKHSNEDIQK